MTGAALTQTMYWWVVVILSGFAVECRPAALMVASRERIAVTVRLTAASAVPPAVASVVNRERLAPIVRLTAAHARLAL